MDRSQESIVAEQAQLLHWGNEPELNPLDAMMWRTERPPANSWTGVVVQIYDVVPDWDRLVAAHEWALELVPRFKEKVVEPLLPVGPPVWTIDPDFDLNYHLRRVRLPAPGTMQQVLELAQTQAVVPLDRNRPPWVVLSVEGLGGGRYAHVMQCHHVLMDGGAATQLFARIMGRERDGNVKSEPESDGPRETFTAARATSRGLSRTATSLPATLGKIGAGLAEVAAHPGRAVKYAASVARIVAPNTTPVPDLFQGGPRRAWRFGTLECSLADLKAAGKAAGGTVNDAFVAAVLGGLREYGKAQGTELTDVPISMPVSVRRADDAMGGNRFTGAFFAAPASIEDPAERIQAMRERVSAVRDEPALDVMGAVTPLMNFAPSQVVTTAIQNMTSNAVLTTSSWPGLTEYTYLAGARFERMFVFGPLPGTSMCAALCSHVGTCCIAINVDGAVFTDLDSLWPAMQQGLNHVLALKDR